MVRHRRPPSQTWRTFLNNHLNDLTIWLLPISLWFQPLRFGCCLYSSSSLTTVVAQFHFAVTSHPTAEWTARQLVQAFPWDSAPRLLVRDRDAIYGNLFR